MTDMTKRTFNLHDIVEPKISAGQTDARKRRFVTLAGSELTGEIRYQVRAIEITIGPEGRDTVYKCIAVARTGDIRGTLVNFNAGELVLSHPFKDDEQQESK